jgi:hypothetical protein
MWYDNSRILSYNKIFNFVIGNRGGGKTFNSKMWSIKDFKKNGKEFIYVRRYKDEMKKSKKTFFNAIKEYFPDDKLEVIGDYAYCNGKLCGYFIVLSTSLTLKSVEYPNVNKIIFDEFLIDKSYLKYIPNEVHTFLNLYETVDRLRDEVRVLFLGNNISIMNPYFIHYKLKPNLSKRFNKYKFMVVEYYTNEEFIKAKMQTRFGQMNAGTSFGDFNVENKILNDNEIFVKEKSIGSKFIFGYQFNNIKYGVWADFKLGEMYISSKYDKSCKAFFAITKADHSPNLLLLKSLRTNPQFQRVSFAYENGILFFDDMQVKNQFYEMFNSYLK